MSTHKLPSPAVLRKAALKLAAPTGDMLLDPNMLKASRNLTRLLRQPGISQKQIKSALAPIGKTEPPQQFLDFKFTGSPYFQPVYPISKLLSGVYEPVDTVDPLVPASRRYKYPTLTHSSNYGGGYAYNNTGAIHTLQSVNLNATSETTFAGF